MEKIGVDFEFDRADLLGKGAWGEVYVGKQISLNRPIAIKILKKELTADPDYVRRFRREAECLAKMTESHIVQVYSAGQQDESHYFIMEFVQGVPLSRFMEKQHSFTPEEIVYVAASVSQALKSAWNCPAKIVHRDIKPANIMVSFSSSFVSTYQRPAKSPEAFMADVNLKDTQIKVMDYGLAKTAMPSSSDQEHTLVGTVIGTPKYISPEQGMGQVADIRSDIYSLGIVLYEMATGKIPFTGDSAISVIRHHIQDAAAPISQMVANFPAPLEAIIMKCIKKDPDNRYANPSQLLADLDAFEKSKPLVHTSTESLIAARKFDATVIAKSDIAKTPRKAIYIIAGGVAIVALIILGIFFLLPAKNTSPEIIPPALPDKVADGIPANGIIECPVDQILKWDAASRAESYDVYLSTANTINAAHKKISTAELFYKPSKLAYNTTYFWHVDARSSAGVSTGSVWSFSTVEPPAEPVVKESVKPPEPIPVVEPATTTPITAKPKPPEPVEDTTAIKKQYEQALDRYRMGELDRSKELLEEILKNNNYTPAQTLLTEIQNKLEETKNTKLALAEAIKQEPLKAMDNPKTVEHNKFNFIVKSINNKDYKTARSETNKFIDANDAIIAPAAIYLQMRIWFVSRETGFLEEMNSLNNRFTTFYPNSDFMVLAVKILNDANIASETDAVDKVIAASEKEKDLNAKINILEKFIESNSGNKFLAKVKAKKDDVIRELANSRGNRYKEAIKQANDLLNSGRYKQAFTELDKARGYADDFSEIESLGLRIRQAYMKSIGIESKISELADKGDAFSFKAIKNAKDDSELLYIPSGEFTRGANDGSANEGPAMMVKINAFFCDKYEVTNRQFKKFVDETKYVTEAENAKSGWVLSQGVLGDVKSACWKDPQGDGKGIDSLLDHPVVQVSRKDAEAYAKWVNKRLLTEAEWEKVGRADQALVYPWGNQYIERNANCKPSSGTTPAGSFQNDKSPYGCFDMVGNVSEWCADYYDPTYYQFYIIDNPRGPGTGSSYVIRGGSWINSAANSKLTARKGGVLSNPKTQQAGQYWTNFVGFRCAMDTISVK